MPRARLITAADSTYIQRKAQQPLTKQLFGPWRNRRHDTSAMSEHASTHFDRRGGIQRDPFTRMPHGKPRFWQIPPEYRSAAAAYEAMLCDRWSSRIRHTPNFRRVLHMITVNQFKNPGQSREAWWKGRGQMAKVHRVRNGMMREVLSDEDNTSVKLPPAGVVKRLPL